MNAQLERGTGRDSVDCLVRQYVVIANEHPVTKRISKYLCNWRFTDATGASTELPSAGARDDAHLERLLAEIRAANPGVDIILPNNDLRRKVEEDADRIRELEEQIKVKEFLLNEAIKDLETEQAESRELYAMLGHIVDWSPELPYYMKDEYKTLFRNALAAARELLSKCKVKEGK